MDSLEVEVNTLDAALAKLNWEIAQQIDSINRLKYKKDLIP